MDALVALNRLVYIVCAILAVKDRYECFVEGHIKDPVHEEDHVTEEADNVLRVVFAVLQEIVHVQEEGNDRQQVEDAEDHKGPIKEGAPRVVDSLDHTAVVTQLDDEVQEKLVLPFKFLQPS